MSEVSPVYEEVYYVSQIGVDEAYYGKELQNGMVVLTMKSESRTSYIEGSNLNNATYDQFNRWCRVSGLTVRSSGVRFFGTYADGSQLLHFSDHYDGWYVKIDSIPVIDTQQSIDYTKFTKVESIVKSVMSADWIGTGSSTKAEIAYGATCGIFETLFKP